ncbi:MAG TPA: MBL fold metallo-hydrolase [Spirochaetota bacterium]|nr:MBL fold metallo-hydrolase [Spirochaetota bacterium]
MNLLKKILIIVMVILMTSTLAYSVNGDVEKLFDDNGWKESVSSVDTSLFYAPHSRDGEYFNPWLEMDKKGFFTVLKWRFFSKKAKYTAGEENFFPGVSYLTSEYINSGDNFMSWIGHASVLIKVSGDVIIIDPVFGDIPFVKKRKVQSALTFEEAGKIKGNITVLITHNHYDHLDEESIKCLPEQTEFIVPAGLSPEILKMRGDNADVTEMDWWENTFINTIKVTFLPSQHWSRRAFSGVNSSLWGSFLINTGKNKIFICGDTGYSRLYKEFSLKFPGIDYAFISAGAYHPRWFMHYAHQDDSEAILGFKELKAEKMIPFHWGSFRLGDEPVGHPAIHIRKKFPDAIIMDHGDIIKLDK